MKHHTMMLYILFLVKLIEHSILTMSLWAWSVWKRHVVHINTTVSTVFQYLSCQSLHLGPSLSMSPVPSTSSTPTSTPLSTTNALLPIEASSQMSNSVFPHPGTTNVSSLAASQAPAHLSLPEMPFYADTGMPPAALVPLSSIPSWAKLDLL